MKDKIPPLYPNLHASMAHFRKNCMKGIDPSDTSSIGYIKLEEIPNLIKTAIAQ
jgi:hypothetical protein